MKKNMIEKLNPPQKNKITPELLLKDNHSPEAVGNIDNWYALQEQGLLTGLVGCGDARAELTLAASQKKDLVSLRSIAATGTSGGSFKYLLNHYGIQKFAVIGHFDGDIFRAQGLPHGCGGLTEKEKVIRKGIQSGKGVIDYLINCIDSPDVVVQTIRTALEMSKFAEGRAVLAAVMDHLSFEIYPLAVITEMGHSMLAAFPIAELYNPENIYKKGIPVLDDKFLGVFSDLIRANRIAVAYWKKTGDRESQKVQNPQGILISTSIIPMTYRFPEIAGGANKLFKVTLQYEKDKEGNITGISNSVADLIIKQVEYPITHNNKAKPGESFEDTKTLIIETPTMEASQYIAKKLIEKDWMETWIKNGGQIIINVIQKGRIIESQLLEI